MFLYRLEASGQGFPPLSVIVLAESDEQAFLHAQAQIERDFLGSIAIQEFVLVQKKPVVAGQAYTVEKRLDQEEG
ncbi:DUF3906 family protein [Effusibacillus pohliae]|uniref:DUF3906 family protein n=1 Tax=Effusibacillus pohliae TaxID=232270 RepID=UPI00036105C6|nr:DUF3906 family protein [Effusibacillus pohliae]